MFMACQREAAGTPLETFEALIHEEDRAGVTSAMQEAVRSGSPRGALYRLLPKPDVDERWIEMLATLLRSKDGPIRLAGVCWDVTARVKIHHELRMRAKQQEGIARLGERGLTENNLPRYFDDAVAAIAQFIDVEMVKVLELLPGDAELVLRSGVGFRPGMLGVAHVSTSRDIQAGFMLAAGGPVITEISQPKLALPATPFCASTEPSAVFRFRSPAATAAPTACSPRTDSRRKFSEYDVSFVSAVANLIAGAIQRLHLDRRQELMIRELRHQSGNLFSQLLAMFSQTAKNSKNIEELSAKYEARVLGSRQCSPPDHRRWLEGCAIAGNTQHAAGALCRSYQLRRAKCAARTGSTFGLSMAVHELASNAGQHGSLSSRVGRVDVTWQVNRTGQGLTLVFEWKEREGPPPKRVRKPGFGSATHHHDDRAPAKRRSGARIFSWRFECEACRAPHARPLVQRDHIGRLCGCAGRPPAVR